MTFSSCIPGFPGGIKSRCSSFTLGDVNGDRPLDVLIGNVGDPPGNYDGAASELLLQQSDGTFVAAAGFPDGSECSSWRARDVLQVNLGAIGALRAAELSLAVKLSDTQSIVSHSGTTNPLRGRYIKLNPQPTTDYAAHTTTFSTQTNPNVMPPRGSMEN